MDWLMRGSLVRIGPDHLASGDPDIIRQIWAVRSSWTRGPFYEASRFDPSRDNIISLRDDAAHNRLRTMMAAGVRDASLCPPRDAANLLETGKQDADVNQYIEMVERSMPSMITLSLFPGLTKVLQSRFFRWMMPSDQDLVGFGHFIGIVEQRLALGKTNQRDILGSFLARGLTKEEAQGELLVAVIAGSDTTATAIRSTLLFLMTFPSTYQTLKAELKKGIREDAISCPIQASEARNLPYLQAVIKEGLRMFPPVPHMMMVAAPRGGDVLKGIKVPEGTQLGVAYWPLVRDKRVFGDDASVFRPERWLEAETEQLRKMTATVDLIFRAGKWQCLGKVIAFMELEKVFVELARKPLSTWRKGESELGACFHRFTQHFSRMINFHRRSVGFGSSKNNGGNIIPKDVEEIEDQYSLFV
ncbi:MAG: hypothetical protein Q9227_002017 [Pyrenula ochraceoflavens]